MNSLRRVLLLVLLGTLVAHAQASDLDLETHFAKANQALDKGSIREAIDTFELLADHGIQHPDVSFNRGLAYIRRAESPQARPGDLGRAAAALSEAVMLRPDDAEAEKGLRMVREEIGRRRARQGADQVMASPSLSRATVGLLSENVWAVIAALGSALISVGLGLRLWSSHAGARLAGGLMLGLGACFLPLGGGFTLAARHYRVTSVPAVVVAPEARLLDETGRPLAGAEAATIAEGQQVYVVAEREQRAKVEWGTNQGWVNRAQLQLLKR